LRRSARIGFADKREGDARPVNMIVERLRPENNQRAQLGNLMDPQTLLARRIGRWSAIALVAIALVYVGAGAIWLASNTDPARARGLQPSEPYLSILEILILLTTPALIALFAAIHAYAPPDRKTCGLAALGFVVLLVALTGSVHFVQLTVVRRTASATVAEVFALYTSDNRLSAALAVELLGWDFFFGFALLFAAPVFKGDMLQALVRAGLIVCGLLCLVGVAGPASGDMRFQLPAIMGYAFGFPFVCLLLAKLFTRSDKRVG
jgi:hypothetical protein